MKKFHHIQNCDYRTYKDCEEFKEKNPAEHYYYLTRYGKKTPSEFDFTKEEDQYFVLGRESSGIPLEILREDKEHCMRLPMKSDARALNLSNCAAIIVYEVLRQLDYPNLSGAEVIKGKDWLVE